MSRFGGVRLLVTAHDLALFQVAFAETPASFRAAERRLRELCRDAARRRMPADSGMPGSTIETGFSLAMTRWLVQRFPRAVEIAWEDEEAGEGLEAALPELASRVEWNGLIDPAWSTAAWCRAAAGPGQSVLAWLLARIARLELPAAHQERWFEALQIDVKLRLEDPRLARGLLRFPTRRAHFHRGSLQRRIDLSEVVSRPLPRPAALAAPDRAALLDTMRLTLLLRGRETDPITDADLPAIRLYRLERGIDVALVPLSSDRRLPLESYIGFVAARNRVPVAYGGAWIFARAAEVGVNVFPEFRGGESALIFGQVLRSYAQAAGVGRFAVDPYQFGRGNPEAIRSGAFWFYYRLGFRPADPRIARQAEEEALRLAASPRGAKSPATLLRRFAADQLVWRHDDGASAPDPACIARAVTEWIGTRHSGDAEAARRAALQRLRRVSGLPLARPVDLQRMRWLEELALAFAPLGPLDEWSRRERAELLAIARAKGGAGEWEYVTRLNRHRRLIAAWSSLRS